MVTARQIAINCVKIEIGTLSIIVDGDLTTMSDERRLEIGRELLASLIELEGETDEVQKLRRSLDQ